MIYDKISNEESNFEIFTTLTHTSSIKIKNLTYNFYLKYLRRLNKWKAQKFKIQNGHSDMISKEICKRRRKS